jgi:hypothetical protein
MRLSSSLKLSGSLVSQAGCTLLCLDEVMVVTAYVDYRGYLPSVPAGALACPTVIPCALAQDCLVLHGSMSLSSLHRQLWNCHAATVCGLMRTR